MRQSNAMDVLTARGVLLASAARAFWKMGALERSEGTLLRTLARTRSQRNLSFARDWSFAELLEWATERYRARPFLEYGDETLTFDEMNRRANRVARGLREVGVGPGVGVAIMHANHPRFLDAFFAVQKLGGYVVPVNTALVSDGLAYILDHSEVQVVVCDHEAGPKIQDVRDRLPRVEHVFWNDAEAPEGAPPPRGTRPFGELERGPLGEDRDLGVRPPPDAPSLLMYTSGTTGLPKAVVSPYAGQRVKNIGLLAHLLYDETDKLYTCLPLFHANALMLSIMQALWVGIPVCLSQRFSASRFWQEVAACGATQFNTVGGMIPILLKTPPSPFDRQHRVRRVLSAACPKDAWVPFERRFGVKLWEGYGAVDGAGVTIFNTGAAPIGSLGRPGRGVRWRLVGEDGLDVPVGSPGELWVYVGDKRESKVQYWKNDKASSEKVVEGWLRTGDMMQADAKGFLYFVGRNTDSMRRRGENVSAYEVEKVVDAHPSVLESAAFGVASPLGEQDIMISVVPLEGQSLDPEDLLRFMEARLPKYAVPSYLDLVESLPKTGTHRVVKAPLKERGVTDRTIRLDAWKAGG